MTSRWSLLLKKPHTVYFEPDTGETVGFGHLARSVTIARCIIRMVPGVELIFSGRFNDASERALQRWLPAAGRQAGLTGEPAIQSGPGTVIFVDQRHSAGEVIRRYRRAGRLVVCIEDLGPGRSWANILVDPNLDPRTHHRICRHHGASPDLALLGPDHVLLAPVVRTLRRQVAGSSTSCLRVLLTFGGGDPDGISEKVLSFLLPVAGRYTITLVLGPLVSEKRVVALMKQANDRVRVVREPVSLPELMTANDLAVTVPGITLWELACLGVPSIVTWVRPHQRRMAHVFEKNGWGINAGPLKRLVGRRLVRELKNLSDSATRRQHIRLQARKGVDGLGLDRLIETMFGSTL